MNKQPMIFVTGESIILDLSFEEQSKLLESLENSSGYEEISENIFLISDESLVKQLQDNKTVASL